MTKIAFFVEGQTEKIFIKQLLNNIFGSNKFNFITPGNVADLAREIRMAEQKRNNDNKDIVLIYNVGGNSDTVASTISVVGRNFLEKAGYNKIFGICDLYKKKERKTDKKMILNRLYESIDIMWFGLNEEIINNVKDMVTSRQLSCLKLLVSRYYPETKLIKELYKIGLHRGIVDIILEPMKQSRNNLTDRISLILAVMETEAWFLADHNLFSKIDSKLTPGYIKQELQRDLIKDDPEEDYDKPADIIKDIYDLAGKHYRKRYGDSCNIVNNINYDYLYCETRDRKISAFHLLVEKLDEVLNHPVNP